MYILGISCFYHESAAALLKDGQVIAASAEERFSRKKHDSDFPIRAIDFCRFRLCRFLRETFLEICQDSSNDARFLPPSLSFICQSHDHLACRQTLGAFNYC